MGEHSGVWFTVEYGADVRLANYNYTGSFSTGGGEFSEGEIGYHCPPPASARHVWFDFYRTADDHHRACRLTIDLASKQAQITQ